MGVLSEPGAACEYATARLAIRRMAAGDAPFILELFNEPPFLRFIGDKRIRTVDDARRYIEEGPIASHARRGFGLDVVRLRDSGEAIGICGLLKRDTLPHPDIGFAYLERHCGAGYGYEAAAACLARADSLLRIPRVLAITSPDNAASIRLLERLGFVFERLASLSPGEPEVRLYSRG